MACAFRLAAFAIACAVSASAATTGVALGTAPPPDSLGGVTVLPYPLDVPDGRYRPGLGADVTAVPGHVGSVSFDAPFNHRRVGQGWDSWSHGYTGDVYVSNGRTTTTLTLPTGYRAFVLYISPEPGIASQLVLISTPEGKGLVEELRLGETRGFAFYTDPGEELTSIQIVSKYSFAIGEFHVSVPTAQLNVTNPTPLANCCFEFELGQYAGTPGDITQVVAQVLTPGVTIVSAANSCGTGPAPVTTATTASWQIPGGMPASFPTYSHFCTVQICFSQSTAPNVVVAFTGSSITTIGSPPTLTQTLTLSDPECGLPIQPPYPTGCNFFYTTDAHFNLGTMISVNHDPPNNNQLQISYPARPLPYIAVPCSNRGTIVRIDVNTGTILGEYISSPNFTVPVPAGFSPPDQFGPQPSRTTVDLYGNVWFGNRREGGSPTNPGSVVKIGLLIGGTRCTRSGPIGGPYTFTPNPAGQYVINPSYCTGIDRDGDGAIKTSRGLNDILPWPGSGPSLDGQGGGILAGVAQGGPALVADAEDELILVFQRTHAWNVRHVSIDANNNIWIGGNSGGAVNQFDHLNGTDGAILTGSVPTLAAPGCPGQPIGGYGGLTNCAGVLWSASLGSARTWRYDTSTLTSTCITLPGGTASYGLGIDTDGWVWNSDYPNNNVFRIHPSGAPILGPFASGGIAPTGLAITPADNDVWLANRYTANVTRLNNNGTPQTGVLATSTLPVGSSPTGVAIDSNGKAWVTNYGADNVMRINPNSGPAGAVDLTVSLNPTAGPPVQTAGPYTYGDMTGMVALNSTTGQGSWTVIQDSGVPGQCWGKITWNTEPQGLVPPGTSIIVEARAAASPVGLSSQTFVPVTNGAQFNMTGRYIEVRVTLKGIPGQPCGTPTSPILSDLRIQCGCGGIIGTKWNDCNCDGIRQPNEPGLPGWTITLNPGGQTAVTGPNGHYNLLVSQAGTYTVTETPQSCWSQSFPAGGVGHTVTLATGQVVSNLNFGNCRRCCGRVSSDAVLCNCPAGGYVYAFTLQNDSTQTVQSLSFANVTPAGVSITGGAIPPLSPGASQPLSFNIVGGTAGAQVCFDLVLRNSAGNEICRVCRCITLPVCDCVVFLNESVSAGPNPNTFIYSFRIQNRLLSTECGDPPPPLPQQVGHVFLADDPAAPAATFSPNYFNLTTAKIPPCSASGGGLSPWFQTTITLPPGWTSGPYCFNIITTRSEVDCSCKLEHCIQLPDWIQPGRCCYPCTLSAGRQQVYDIGPAACSALGGTYFIPGPRQLACYCTGWVFPRLRGIATLGGAIVDAFENPTELLVRLRGSLSGDGVCFETGAAEAITAEIAQLFSETDLYPGSAITARAYGPLQGQAGQELGSLTLEQAGAGLDLTVDFEPLGAPTHQIDIYNDGKLLERTTWHRGRVARVFADPPQRIRTSRFGDSLCLQLSWGQRVQIDVVDGPSLTGDELRIIAEEPTAAVTATDGLCMLFAGTPDILIRDVVVRPTPLTGDMDCSGSVDFNDIESFVAALVGREAYEALVPDCHYLNGDVNADGLVNFDDIPAFVTLLSGG